MKTKILSLLAAVALVVAVSSVAKADTCNPLTSTTSCSIDLTVTNGFAPSGPVYGTVSLTLNQDGTISITEAVSSTDYAWHNAVFGFNTNGVDPSTLFGVVASFSPSAGTPPAPTWTGTNPGCGSQNEDGFGQFQCGFNGGTGSANNYSSLTFVISTTTEGGFTSVAELLGGSANGKNTNPNNFFAAQITYLPNGCTGFVGNTGSSNGSTTANCVSTNVPEPGSLMLFGSAGLLGMAGFLLRKMLS